MPRPNPRCPSTNAALGRTADPGENENQFAARSADAGLLAARLPRFGDGLQTPDRPGANGADTRWRLAALGYVSSGGDLPAGAPRPDPKDRRELAARMALAFSGELTGEALRQSLARLARTRATPSCGRSREAERILSDAALVEPGNPVVEANRGWTSRPSAARRGPCPRRPPGSWTRSSPEGASSPIAIGAARSAHRFRTSASARTWPFRACRC